MSNTPPFREELISQIPALQLLMAMGYEYLTPDDALAKRGGKFRNVILEDVLVKWLREHNRIHYKGQEIPFSEANIQKFARIKDYKPNARFNESTAFTSEADKTYRKSLIDKRTELAKPQGQ